ncbi:putative basic proline-rich protein-like [Iris pallida]|uniref:Basic proline-rich protein-like n=1 Tax=Iris pallida TaxID=29817 RepID=A0AAX6DSW2_IRIPA|nr:putative basic proline-rich protein-like [Iris pallida]
MSDHFLRMVLFLVFRNFRKGFCSWVIFVLLLYDNHFGLDILVGNGFFLVWDILQEFVGALPSSWVCPEIEEVLPKFLQKLYFY